MNSTWSVFGREVMAAFDLAPFPLICDLGGMYHRKSQLSFSFSNNEPLRLHMSKIWKCPKVTLLVYQQPPPPKKKRNNSLHTHCY